MDNLFDHKNICSSSTSPILDSIFPPPARVVGNQSAENAVAGNGNGKQSGSSYQNETVEPSYFSSSIYYGGQELYSSTTTKNRNNNSHQFIIKKGERDNPNGNSNAVSRGDWWQGSLYY